MGWKTLGAERVELNGEPVRLSDGIVVAPAETTVFTLSVINSAGARVEQRLRIIVEEESAGAPRRRRSVTVELREKEGVDLDGGTAGGDRGAWDVWLGRDVHGERFLYPQYKATLAAIRPGSLRAANGDPAVCEKARLRADPIPIAKLAEGSEICVRTNEGRIAWIRVQKPADRSSGPLVILFATWDGG